MSFMVAALRNRTFLCAAIVVSAVVVIMADMFSERLPLLEGWDAFELLMVLLVAMYLPVAEHDEFRELTRGFLYLLPFMMVIAHIFG